MKPISINAATWKPLSEAKGAGGLEPGWFSIPYRCVSEKRDRRLATGRWFKLSSEAGSIYRILRFSSASFNEESGKCELILDYDGRLKLCDYSESMPDKIENLKISKCRWWEYIFCVTTHPDPTYRLSGCLGIISLFLGFLGVIFALINLFGG